MTPLHALALCTTVALAGRPPATITVRAPIRHVQADRVFLDVGTADQVTVGSEADVVVKGDRVARLRIAAASAHHSAAVFIKKTALPRAGDVAVITATVKRAGVAAPPVRTFPTPVPPGTWQRVTTQAYPQQPSRLTLVPPPLARTSAFLRASGWVYGSGGLPTSATQRQRISLMVDSPVDAKDQFHVSARADIVAQALRPGDARFERDSVAWVELHEAQLAYRGSRGLELAVGRRAMPGLRWGLLDGAHATWRFARALTVRVMVGEAPQTAILRPDYRRPAAYGSLDGAVALPLASFSYGAAVSWLGRDVVDVEATEASARFNADLGRILWLEGDAAAIAWLAKTRSTPWAALDRVGLAGSFKLGRSTTVRASARRLGGAILPSQAAMLPPGYLSGRPFFDVGAAADTTVLLPGGVSVGAALSTGALWDESHAADRVYVTPEVRARLLRLWNLYARIALQGELGSIAGEFVSVGVGAEPAPGFRVALSQQTGVWLMQDLRQLEDTRQVLPTSQWQASAEYRFLRYLSAGMRGRLLYGNAGQGLEAHAFIGAVDWW